MLNIIVNQIKSIPMIISMYSDIFLFESTETCHTVQTETIA